MFTLQLRIKRKFHAVHRTVSDSEISTSASGVQYRRSPHYETIMDDLLCTVLYDVYLYIDTLFPQIHRCVGSGAQAVLTICRIFLSVCGAVRRDSDGC
jgi:hypothetical protein